MKKRSLQEVLMETQRYMTGYYASAFIQTDRDMCENYIKDFIKKQQYTVPGYTELELCQRISDEMVGYSILTPYLYREDVDEINVNAWDDIAVTYHNGKTVKCQEHFFSPNHAEDIIKRLLHSGGGVLDTETPICEVAIGQHTRISALQYPVVEKEIGIAASIRLLRPEKHSLASLLEAGMASEEMMAFLKMCFRFSVSTLIAGRTSSGKTTLLCSLLSEMPPQMRLYTIESGARELFLEKKDENGNKKNNLVQTCTRKSENEKRAITQSHLIVSALRFTPDLIAIGEIRDVEALDAVEASLTGHPVTTTLHAGPGKHAHTRMAFLCQRKYALQLDRALSEVQNAFPIIVFVHKGEDNIRRVLDISECVIDDNGAPKYLTLYRYESVGYDKDGQLKGHFVKVHPMSNSLYTRFLEGGVPKNYLQKFGGNAT